MARDTGEFPGAVKAPAGLPRDDPGRPRQGRCSEGRGALQRPRDRSAGGEGVAESGSSAAAHSGGAPTALAAGAPRVREIAG